MKHASTLKRGRPLARSASKLSRSARLKKVGRRGAADREAIALVRAEVLARCGGRCERCWGRRKLDLHHRLPRSRGGEHTAANLCALCRVCHAQVHAGSSDAAKWIVTRRGVA